MTLEWTPLTEEERWRNAGLGPVLDAAAEGNEVAALLVSRLKAAEVQMQPEIDRLKAEIEREWMEGSATPSSLSLLIDREPEA